MAGHAEPEPPRVGPAELPSGTGHAGAALGGDRAHLPAVAPPAPPFLHYQAAKAALDNYSAGLAATLAPSGVRVNTVSPGRTATPGGEETREHWASLDAGPAPSGTAPLGRDGLPDDIAHAVLYLVSDRAGWVTGTSLAVDGGEYPRG